MITNDTIDAPTIRTSLSPEAQKSLNAVTDKTGMTEDEFITLVFENTLATPISLTKDEIEQIKQAVIEANEGAFISSDAMGAWIRSLGTDNELAPPMPDVFV